MPKEYTHWCLAQKALAGLPAGPAATAAGRHTRLYLVGAVAPDTPMYALSHKHVFGEAAQRLHSREGNNPFAGLARLVRTVGDPPPADAAAFVMGVVCHLTADALYHPWIMHYSGSCHDMPPDLQPVSYFRHRQMETVMDVANAFHHPRLAPRRLAALVRGPDIPCLARWGRALYFASPDHRTPPTDRVIASHVLLSDAFASPLASRLAHLSHRLLGQPSRPFIALFHPPRRLDASRLFTRKIPYLHPVTGDRHVVRLKDLDRRVALETARLFMLMEPRLSRGGLADFFDRTHAPSPETGLVGVPSKMMTHFDLDADLDTLLYGGQSPG